MRFYNRQHRHYCGIDLHVKTMYVCILDATGQVLVHRNVTSRPEAFLLSDLTGKSRELSVYPSGSSDRSPRASPLADKPRVQARAGLC